MLEKDWVRFVIGIAKTVVKYMLLGTVIVGSIGVLIALAAALFGDAGPLTLSYVASVAGNYARIGLFGGGILGILYGILSQGSYS